MNIEVWSNKLSWDGPDRVMVSPDYATSNAGALMMHGVEHEVVFIRDDDWMLGAPPHLEANAYAQWPDTWVAFIRRGDTEFTPISEYRPR